MIDTKTVLKTIKGENYQTDGKDLTLGDVLGNILIVQKSSDPWKQYKVTLKVSQDPKSLKAEDVTFIKKVVEDHAKSQETAYFPFILGQVIDILEQI